jgi:hypothetical protein
MGQSVASTGLSPSDIRKYVLSEAKRYGVNPQKADWIVSHESRYDPTTIGDDGISVGIWQFNLKANPQIPKACAEDVKCSTDLAMRWILAGKIKAWSTYSFCRDWYPNCPF